MSMVICEWIEKLIDYGFDELDEDEIFLITADLKAISVKAQALYEKNNSLELSLKNKNAT